MLEENSSSRLSFRRRRPLEEEPMMDTDRQGARVTPRFQRAQVTEAGAGIQKTMAEPEQLPEQLRMKAEPEGRSSLTEL